MTNKLSISQIFIPNTKQALNYVSLYEETVRHDQPVSLFLVFEIRGDRRSPAAAKQQEYEKIAAAMARNLKNTFVAETKLSELTFEKALSNINNELSQMARNGVVGWYKKLNALVAAYTRQSLFISTTGTPSAYLLRGKEFTQISDQLSPGEKPHPLKTFANFAAGALAENDYAIFANSSLYNYVSLEKIKQILGQKTLEEASKDVIATLKQDAAPAEAFAAFVCKVSSRLNLADADLHPLMAPASHTIIEDSDNLAATPQQRAFKSAAVWGQAALGAADKLWKRLLATTARPIAATSESSDAAPRRATPIPKPVLAAGLAVVALLLAGTLYWSHEHNVRKQQETDAQHLLTLADRDITDAASALIYDDHNRAVAAATKAQGEIDQVKKQNLLPADTKKLSDRLDTVLNQLNKITVVDSLDTLGTFAQTPDQLIRTPDGFAGFNSFTDSVEFFQNASGAVKPVTPVRQFPENIVAGFPTGNPSLAVFLSTMGNFYQLDFLNGSLTTLSANSTSQQDLSLVGARSFGGRIYSISRANAQIVRFQQTKQGFAAAQNWLKAPGVFGSAQDLAIDGSVWVLSSDNLAKFTKGAPQPFALPSLPQPFAHAKKIWTNENSALIYIADPEHQRIVVINKQGGLMAQYVSPKFSDLKDFTVDEGQRTIYLISGNALDKFKY